MAAKHLSWPEVLVAGADNGAVYLHCGHCDELLAGGGCDCCEGNDVTLQELINAAEEPHECEAS